MPHWPPSHRRQDLPALRTLLGALHDAHHHPDEPHYLSYCGEAGVAAHGLRVLRLPAASAEPCPFWSEPLLPPAPPAAPETAGGLPGVPTGPGGGDEGSEAAVEAAAPVTPAADGAMEVADGGGGTWAGGGELAGEAAATELRPGLYCVDASMLQGLAPRLKGPWSTDYDQAYQRLRARGLLLRSAAAALRFARLCAYLRRTPPLASAGATIFVWRLSAADLHEALLGAPAELVPSALLSPALREHQRRMLRELLGELAKAL